MLHTEKREEMGTKNEMGALERTMNELEKPFRKKKIKETEKIGFEK